MSIFDSLNGKRQQLTPQQAMQQLRSDPVATLKQAGLSVPAGMDNPQQIINHLIHSGQLPQNRLTTAVQMAHRMGMR